MHLTLATRIGSRSNIEMSRLQRHRLGRREEVGYIDSLVQIPAGEWNFFINLYYTNSIIPVTDLLDSETGCLASGIEFFNPGSTMDLARVSSDCD